MNKADRKRFDKLTRLGCVICENPFVEIHHVRHSGKRDNQKTFPLCFLHHRGGGHGVAIHDGLETWEENHGTESSLLVFVNKYIG